MTHGDENLEHEPATAPDGSASSAVADAAPSQLETVKSAGRAVTDALKSLGKTVDARVRHECRENPYRTIAAAAAVGFAVRNGQAARLLMLAGSKFAVQALAGRAEPEA